MILVELCAGSAAVSLRWLRADARPPLAYQGGKRGYADQILQALGLQPGGGRGQQVVLCEPGPWGEAWALWRTTEGRADTIGRLRAWVDEDPRTLWERLRTAPVPTDERERVAAWAVLNLWSFGQKPILIDGGWVHHGFNPAAAYRLDYHESRRKAGLRVYTGDEIRIHKQLIPALEALPDLSRLTVLQCRAEDVALIPGAVVLIDPPYQGTTCAYGHSLPRSEVLSIATRWRAAGCIVAICEAEPLPLVGWHHHELGGPSGFGRTWSRQRREVLTMSRPAAGQLDLLCNPTGMEAR